MLGRAKLAAGLIALMLGGLSGIFDNCRAATMPRGPADAMLLIRGMFGSGAAAPLAFALASMARLGGDPERALAYTIDCSTLAARWRMTNLQLNCIAIGAETAVQVAEISIALEMERTRLRIARQAGLRAHIRDSLNSLALLSRRGARYERAEDLAREALSIARADRAYDAEALALSNLSFIRKSRGDYLEALELELASLELRSRPGSNATTMISLLNLAAIYEQLEDMDNAREYQARALSASAHSVGPLDLARARVAMAGFLNDDSIAHAPTALALAQLALADYEARNQRAGTLDAHFHIGRALFNLGRIEEASDELALVLEMARSLGYRSNEAHALFRLSETDAARGRLTSAIAKAEQAAELYRTIDNPHRLAKTHGLLEDYYGRAGQELQSLRHGRERLLLRERLLGSQAMQSVNRLLSETRAARDSARIRMLEQENLLNAARIERDAIERRFNLMIAGGFVLAFLALGMRYFDGRRINRHLAAQNSEIEKQRFALAGANVELTVRATTDALTGLTNRGQALTLINDLLSEASHQGRRLALALIDIDHFKRINDNYGHLAGDEVLRQVARALSSALADAPVVARIGGEEFLVCLNEQEPSQIAARLDATRRTVAARRTAYERVTISAGWVLSETGIGVDELLGAADQALYRAKALGRDRVEFAAAVSASQTHANALS